VTSRGRDWITLSLSHTQGACFQDLPNGPFCPELLLLLDFGAETYGYCLHNAKNSRCYMQRPTKDFASQFSWLACSAPVHQAPVQK